MSSLRNKTVSGFIWSSFEKFGSRGISFLVTIILARILTPEAFGLIGMLAIFIQISQVLVTAGFNQALIQKPDVDERDYSSVFYINLVISFLIYILIYFAAPLIADFYSQPTLTELIRVLSLVFVINAFSYVQEAKLTKEMQFKKLTLVHLPATAIGGIVSIIMALYDFGVWSLIAFQLAYKFSYALQIWIYSKWKPLCSFDKRRAKKLFAFGGNLMVSQIINTVFRNGYLIVIGKFFPLSTTGYYQNANNLVLYPTSTITTAINKVIFSAFSTFQESNERLKKNYKKIMQLIFFGTCPIFVLAGVLAVPFFRFVFTEKWLPAVPYFQLLCVVGILWPISTYSLTIVNIKGRSDVTLILEIVKKSIIAVSLVIAIPFGIWYVIIAQVINAIISFFLNAYYSGRFINYSVFKQIQDLLPTALLSSCMGAIVWSLNKYLVDQSDILQILVCGGVGVAVYLIGAKYLSFAPYLEILNILYDKSNKIFYRFRKS